MFTLYIYIIQKVIDISAIGNVLTLNFTFTNVMDLSAFGNSHILHVSETEVTDVSAHGYTLDLRYTQVKDVSKLSNIHNLLYFKKPI